MSETGRLRGVLWDLDDTLFPRHTVARWQWAWRPQGPRLGERHVRAALRKGLKAWDRRRWQGLVGAQPPADAAAERGSLRSILFEIAGHPLPAAEAEAVVNRFLRFPEIPEPFPDVRGCLVALKARDTLMAVLAPAADDRTRFLLRHNHLDDLLPTVVDSGPDAAPATTAERFREACRRLATAPVETAYVGDLYWSDARAASRAELTGILLDRNDWWASVSSPRIGSLAELPAQLEARPSARPVVREPTRELG